MDCGSETAVKARFTLKIEQWWPKHAKPIPFSATTRPSVFQIKKQRTTQPRCLHDRLILALPATVPKGTVSTLTRMRFSRSASESANRIMKNQNKNHKSWLNTIDTFTKEKCHSPEISQTMSETIGTSRTSSYYIVLKTMPFFGPSSQSRPESLGPHRTWWCRPLNRQKTHHHRLPMSDRPERLDHHLTL